MNKSVPSPLIHALLCFLFSAGFLVLGYWYPIFLVKRYGEDDFRGGGAVMLALIFGSVYGVRAVLSLFHLAERGERL